MIFIKIINFLIKIGPLWAHKNFKINVAGLVNPERSIFFCVEYLSVSTSQAPEPFDIHMSRNLTV